MARVNSFYGTIKKKMAKTEQKDRKGVKIITTIPFLMESLDNWKEKQSHLSDFSGCSLVSIKLKVIEENV